jgi:1-acyl-sn-glycerol-3-phosphate acyltransferase
MQRWLSFLWYETTSYLSFAALTLGFSLRTEGGRNIPRSGPALVVANHQSLLDPVLIGVSTQRHLAALARQTLFRHRLFAHLIRSYGAIPIDHQGVGKEGLKTVLHELEQGRAILVFPEGTRTKDGVLHALKPGISLLLKRAPVPVVPVGVAGAFAAWPTWRHYPLPAPLFLPANERTVAVSVGRPLDGRRYAQMPREEMLAELFQELQKWTARAEQLRRKP